MTNRTKLQLFSGFMIAHWSEHIVQIWQLYVLHIPRCCAMGIVGMYFPVLMSGEWLHAFFAVLTLWGIIWLRPAFDFPPVSGWWSVAEVISYWHLFEHMLLFIQAQTGQPWFGHSMPVSILQLVWPSFRAEIHLFYNTVVTIPVLIAMYKRWRGLDLITRMANRISLEEVDSW